ncbi:MAG: hypothetical protein Q7S21_01645 [archaeon]|nr:hypothetical protein [archaeon]
MAKTPRRIVKKPAKPKIHRPFVARLTNRRAEIVAEKIVRKFVKEVQNEVDKKLENFSGSEEEVFRLIREYEPIIAKKILKKRKSYIASASIIYALNELKIRNPQKRRLIFDIFRKKFAEFFDIETTSKLGKARLSFSSRTIVGELIPIFGSKNRTLKFSVSLEEISKLLDELIEQKMATIR